MQLTDYNPYLAQAYAEAGFPDILNYGQTEMTPERRRYLAMALDASRAKKRRSDVITGDAELLTAASNKVGAWADIYYYPETIEVFTQPLSAERILDVRQIGDWTTPLAVVETSEIAGRTAPYGDFDRQGASDVNFGPLEMRQYRFQTMIYYGDLEASVRNNGGAATIDLVARKEAAAAKIINKGHNDIWLRGVAGTEVNGLMNNPDLLPAITPQTTTGGAVLWADKTADEIVSDIDLMYTTLVTQSGGLIYESTPLKLVMSATLRTQLNKRREFTDKTVFEMIKETYPNLTIITAPEYDTEAGGMVQLIAQRITDENGVEHETIVAGFSLRFQGHGKIRDVSSTVEKKSAGNWGTAVWFPFAIVTMLGA